MRLNNDICDGIKDKLQFQTVLKFENGPKYKRGMQRGKCQDCKEITEAKYLSGFKIKVYYIPIPNKTRSILNKQNN